MHWRQPLRVPARLFVIAAGGLETARLLLLSRQQQDVGLGNGHDLVGRYYMDHPGFSGGELEISPSAPSFGFFMDIYSVDDSRLCGIFTPRPEVLLKANLGNFTIKLFPRDIVPGVETSITRMRAGILDRQVLGDIGYHLGNILVDIDQIANLAYKNIVQSNTGFIARREHSRTRRSGATMAVHAEQVPNPESRVLLSDETDLFGQRRLKLDWRLQDADRRTLVQSIGLFATAISAAGTAEFASRPNLRRATLTHWWKSPATIWEPPACPTAQRPGSSMPTAGCTVSTICTLLVVVISRRPAY